MLPSFYILPNLHVHRNKTPYHKIWAVPFLVLPMILILT